MHVKILPRIKWTTNGASLKFFTSLDKTDQILASRVTIQSGVWTSNQGLKISGKIASASTGSGYLNSPLPQTLSPLLTCPTFDQFKFPGTMQLHNQKCDNEINNPLICISKLMVLFNISKCSVGFQNLLFSAPSSQMYAKICNTRTFEWNPSKVFKLTKNSVIKLQFTIFKKNKMDSSHFN